MKLTVAPEAVSSQVDGFTVVLTPDMQFVRLDDTGAAIWEFAQTHRDSEGVVDAMCERYLVDRDTAAADVHRFVQELAKLGLVSVNE